MQLDNVGPQVIDMTKTNRGTDMKIEFPEEADSDGEDKIYKVE